MNNSRYPAVFILFAITISISLVLPCSAEDYVPGDLVVVFSSDTIPVVDVEAEGFPSIYVQLDDVFETYEIQDARALFTTGSPLQNIFLLHFDNEADLDAIAADLSELPFVAAVNKNWIISVDLPPDDYYFSHDQNSSGELDQWTFYTMQLNRAWNVTVGDASVIVAVIDTGFDYLHPDLNEGVAWVNADEDINENGTFDKVPSGSGGDLDSLDNDGNGKVDDVIGWNFVLNNGDPYPTLFPGGNHGTSMSSIIRSETNNNFGVAGATWDAKIMALKCGGVGSVNDAFAVEAINYAAANGARVVNLSFSTTAQLPDVLMAIQAAAAAGVVFVGSAGDFNNETPRYPGSYDEVIRVAAVDSLGYKTSGSSYGTDVEICAPASQPGDQVHGIMVCTYDYGASNTNPGDSSPHVFRYTQIATSGAAAEVTATVALLQSVHIDSSAAFIKKELFRGAKPIPDTLFGQGKLGAGMVNAYRSLTQWGVVASDTAWGSALGASTVYVSGDVIVAEDVTLTILPGTLIRLANQDNEHMGSDEDRVEIRIDGELIVNGTEANPVVFEPWTHVTSEDWVGIYFSEDSGGGTFDHCTLRYAEISIDSYAPITINHSTIRGASDALISIWSSTLNIDNSEISLSNGDGILLNDSDATIASTLVEECVGYGLRMSGNGALNISNSEFRDTDVGVYVENNTTNGTISETRFEDNDVGLSYYYSSKPTIDECVITGNTYGITLDHYASPTILHCINSANYDGDITGNVGGIYCTDNSDPTVGSCNISSNNTGVGAFDNSEPDLDGNGANKFLSNTGYHVANFVSGTMVHATGNYWYLNTGDPDYYPKAQRIYGSVDYEGALEIGPNPVSPGPEPKPEPEVVVAGLGRARPNPFNPTIQIPYGVENPADVQIDVFDVSGRLVRTLVRDHKARGNHVVVWDGTTNSGEPTASAVYFVRMRAGRLTETQKIVLLK